MVFKLLFTKNHERLDPSKAKFIEEHPWEKGFARCYETKIFPLLITFDKKRIKALIETRKRLWIATPILLILAVITVPLIFSSGSPDAGGMISILFSVPFLSFSYYCSRPIIRYKSSVKAKILPEIFSFLGDFEYSEDSKLSASCLKSSEIIPDYSSEKSEDYVKGVYDGVGIELYESKLIKVHTDSKGKRRESTVFGGVFILLEMNKVFKGKTFVKRDLGIFNFAVNAFSKYENVKLEDPIFENKYEVYSTDQIEARFLLTTAFMERFLKLSSLIKSSSIQASFYDNRLLLMVSSSSNRFEASSAFTPATFLGDAKSLLQEMNEIFEIIEELKLNMKIF